MVKFIFLTLLLGSIIVLAEGLKPTPATHEGPLYRAGSPWRTVLRESWDKGGVLEMSGQVLDQSGQPVAEAELDIWQADSTGNYHDDAYRGKLHTDKLGRYTFFTVVPGQEWTLPKHIHLKVTADGYRNLTTQMLFDVVDNPGDSPRSALIIKPERIERGDAEVVVGRFDIVLSPNEEPEE